MSIRDRAWRRKQRRRIQRLRSGRLLNQALRPGQIGRFAKSRGVPRYAGLPREKCWKQLYTRRTKLARARQLGRAYPFAAGPTWERTVRATKILFVCSRNQWRSPTAERVWAREPGISVRSAGTRRNAKRTVTLNDLRWADLIFVMETKHSDRIRATFGRTRWGAPIHVLDIPDDYGFMDPELVEMVRDLVEPFLDEI